MTPRADPFGSDRAVMETALARLVGTETEEQVVITAADGSRGRLDVAHIDDEYAVYIEWRDKVPLEALELELPADSEINDESKRNATITIGELQAAEAAGVLEQWAAQIFGERSELVWEATAED